MNWQGRNSGSGVLGTQLGVDAIAEFQVMTNTYSAQYGGNGAVINSVTRSGSNTLHGSAYEFVRNNVFDARNFYDPSNVPPFRKNQFGGTLGGPITKARLANASLAYPIPKKYDIGRTLLVGAGGIGHAFSWALQFCSVTGTMDICDFEDIEPSNLNRYLCAFVDDVNARKDVQLATYVQSNSQLGATALGEKYEDLVKSNSISIMQYDRVASCVDNVISRYAVQSDLPRLLVNAGTNAYSFQASRHDFLNGACLACLYPPRKGTGHEQRVACDQLAQGQTVRPMESYSMVTGLAGLYLLLQLLADRNWSPHHQGNVLRLDSIIDEGRKRS